MAVGLRRWLYLFLEIFLIWSIKQSIFKELLQKILNSKKAKKEKESKDNESDSDPSPQYIQFIDQRQKKTPTKPQEEDEKAPDLN